MILLREEIQKSKESGYKLECSNTFTDSFGIPCGHKAAEILEERDFFVPDDFHVQWHLKYNPEFEEVCCYPCVVIQIELMLCFLNCLIHRMKLKCGIWRQKLKNLQIRFWNK